MKLTEYFSKKAIVSQLKASDKKGAIKELVQVVKDVYNPSKFQVNDIADDVIKREKLGSTGLGKGVAVPHAKIVELKKVIGAFGRSTDGIDFDAVDGEPVHLIFLILSPTGGTDLHLEALRKIMQAIKRPNFCKFLNSAKGIKDIEDIFVEYEEEVKV